MKIGYLNFEFKNLQINFIETEAFELTIHTTFKV